MSFETRRDCALKLDNVSEVFLRRYILSSLDRLNFSFRISGVINGLRGRDGHVMVLSGACLFSRVVSTELKSSR